MITPVGGAVASCCRFFSTRLIRGGRDSVHAQWESCKSSLIERGYGFLQGSDGSVKTLKCASTLIGPIQKHIRNPLSGITDIVGNTYKNINAHQVHANIEFFPHTDGTYLNGITHDKKGRYFRVGPPSYIILQCVKPSDIGGETVVVDAQKILSDIVKKDPHLIPVLFSKKGMCILRGSHLVMDTPIFSSLDHDRYKIRFSYDQDFLVSKTLKKAVSIFNEKYIQNKEYQHNFKLEKNQIVVIDNYRMLHGRLAFSGERILRRLWIYDTQTAEQLVVPCRNRDFYESELMAESPLIKYQSYFYVSKKKITGEQNQLFPGIKIEKSLKDKITFFRQNNLLE